MAATDARHPRTHQIAPWTVGVSLLPGELLSSWLVRSALAQGCDPLVLTGELWPRWRAWTRDLDRALSVDRLQVLSQRSGTAIDEIEAAMLRPTITGLAESLNTRAVWPWVLTLGTRNRRRHGGLQYCPLCLRSDPRPYYRLQWRLAWHVGCVKHDVVLLDRCPRCIAVIEPHRLLAANNNAALCASCMHDLRDAVSGDVDREALTFQQVADRAAVSGFGRYGSAARSVAEWFTLARYFVGLVRKATSGKLITLIAFLRTLGVEVKSITSPSTGLALEYLPVRDRMSLLTSAWRLIEAGPEQLLAAAEAASLNATALRDRRQAVPIFLKQIIDALPDVHIRRPTRRENNAGVPKSPVVVMRMAARLKRKMHLGQHE